MATKIALIVCLCMLIGVIESHTVMTNIVINNQARTDCLRPTYPDYDANTQMGAQWPISSADFLQNGLTSGNYTCGFLPFANQPAQAKCNVAAGSTVGVSYYHGAYGTEDPVLDQWIARSHKGPFIVYMARSDTGTGNVWFKIYQSGKTQESTNFNNVKWASADTLIENNGRFYFPIPSDLAPGNYLLRTEIIAHHDTRLYGAQPYVRCVELTISGDGSANPSLTGVAIPGTWDENDAGIRYNIYNDFTSPYPFPGPAVYEVGTGPTTEGASMGAAGVQSVVVGLMAFLLMISF